MLHPIALRGRRSAAAAATVVALTFALGACGSSGGDPDQTGPIDQAVEKLEAFGLTAVQAACVVEKVGAATVVEAGDLNALTESQQYQDAAKGCIDD